MNVVFNGVTMAETAVPLATDNRAFLYGDGLFETMRYENGTLWFFPDHVRRLQRGMQALGLVPPSTFTADYLHSCIRQLLGQNGLTAGCARLRLQVWRQPGGLYTPVQDSLDWLLQARPAQPFALTEKERIGLYEGISLCPSTISPFKTGSALPYVMAGRYRLAQAWDDALLLDARGHLAECVASNIFWLRDQTLYTPSLQTGCIEGILRAKLLKLAPALGLVVAEGLYPPAVLAKAEAVFCTNVTGMQSFRLFGEQVLGTRLEPVRALAAAVGA